jgi:hypothetical protein
MTRILDLVADTRRTAYGSMADQLNFLTEEAPLGEAELKMALDLSGITPGMVLSSGLNVYYVVGVVAAEKKVLVYPTYDNSHNDALPIGSPVMIRPRVTDWHIFNLLNDTIKQLSSATSGLYREGSWVTRSTGFTWNTYDIPPEAQGRMRRMNSPAASTPPARSARRTSLPSTATSALPTRNSRSRFARTPKPTASGSGHAERQRAR